MNDEFRNELKQVIETRFKLIGLKLQASKIRNSQNLQGGLDALVEFCGGKKRLNCYNI